MDQTMMSLEIGRTTSGKLTVKFKPENATNQNVSWTSDNPSVATVDENGVVTAKGDGACRIIATAKDGGATCTCEVTVSIAPVKVTGVKVRNCHKINRLSY